MRRIHHLELCDQAAMPPRLREDVHGSLAWLQRRFGSESHVVERVPEIVRELRARTVVELGSAGGDLLAALALALPDGFPLVATDLVPRPATWRRCFADVPGARWMDEPVAIESFDRALPRDLLDGAALLLSAAFHHLDDPAARTFFERAAALRVHVIIAEPLPRSWLGVALGAATGLGALLRPWARDLAARERLRAALTHWTLPIVPFVLSHDGVVSALRQRSAEDWSRLTRGLSYRRGDHGGGGPFACSSITVFTPT